MVRADAGALCAARRAEVTVRGCNCLPEWKVTDNGTGQPYAGLGGNCSHTDNTSVPWCLVFEDTCAAGPFHLGGGEAWDTCVDRGAPALALLPLCQCPALPAGACCTPTLPRRPVCRRSPWERHTMLPARGCPAKQALLLPCVRCRQAAHPFL